jgi:PAS domain S-box-containing protein
MIQKNVLDLLLSGYWEWDCEQDTFFVSNQFKKLLGYSTDEIDDQRATMRDLVLADDLPLIRAAMTEHLAKKTDTPFSAAIRFKRKDGSWVWVQTTGAVMVWNGDAPARIIGYYADLTQAKEIEQRLAEERQLIDDFFDLALDYLCIMDLEGTFLRINAQWERLLGYSPEEIMQRKYLDLVHPDDLAAGWEVAHTLQAEQKVTGHISRVRCRDGSYRHIEWQLRPKNGLLYGAGRDITIRVKAQQDFAKTLKLNASIIDAMSEGVLLQDDRGTVVRCNRAAEQILGLSHDQLLGKRSVDKHWRIVQEDGTDFLAETSPSMRSLRTGQPVFNEVAGVRQPSGELVWVLVNSVPIFGPDGQVDTVVTSLTNITELKAKESELQTVLQKALEQKTKLENFAHIVSHNLRAHSGNIASLVGMLAGAVPADDQAELLAYLAKASARLQQTIADLNEIVDAQRDEEISPIALGEFFEEVLNSITTDLKHKSVELVVDIPPGLVVNYKKAYLESILLNFVTNGIKYRHPDRLPVIRLRAYREAGRAILEIEDNGIGIDLDTHGDKLFGMYKTFHGNADAKGIGLYITKNQVEEMGGSIAVESRVGEGTKFIIVLGGGVSTRSSDMAGLAV